ncbi:MAG: hypothetical protein WBV71_13350 [Roseobacter sp.]
MTLHQQAAFLSVKNNVFDLCQSGGEDGSTEPFRVEDVPKVT